ncbi:hypothetical protein [Lentzea sp. NPDC051838]|uniref:hypothetical protein n=1 Tax=Lentzea sp. NPDC051838 TaxID=3154849 RepID=UPI003433578F
MDVLPWLLAVQPSTSPGTTPGVPAASPWVPVATLVAAVIAAIVAGVAAVLQRKSGREAAQAAHLSAAASQRAASAAEAAVELNDRVSTGNATRSEADSLAKRYQDAASQLGHEKAVVRMAGVVAMAHLADDWPQQRQMCVDVLCGYLRMPPSALTERDAEERAEREVRATVTRLIAAHTRQHHWPGEDAVPSWSACEFDLSGAVIHDLDWVGLTFEKRVHLTGATLTGHCRIINCRFEYLGILLDKLVLEGSLEMYRIEARECGVSLDRAAIRPTGELRISLHGDPGAKWEMCYPEIDGTVDIYISPDAHTDSLVLCDAEVRSGKALIHCAEHELTSGNARPFLNFSGWKVGSEATVRIDSQLMDVWSAEWQPRQIDEGADVVLAARIAASE